MKEWKKFLRYLNPIILTYEQWRLLLFLTLLGLTYIWNSYRMQRLAKELTQLEELLSEKKTEYLTLNAQMSRLHRFHWILNQSQKLGLAPSEKPPYKIQIRKDESHR
jgi:cell division protein FtsL